MTVFLIVRQSNALNNEALEAVLHRKFPNNFYRLGKGQWMVAAPYDNARQLSLEIGIGEGKHYTGTLVSEMHSYYGLHDKKLWDWIKARV